MERAATTEPGDPIAVETKTEAGEINDGDADAIDIETITEAREINATNKPNRVKKIYKCTKCQKGFQSKTSLHYHRQRHIHKRYSCSKCDKAFISKLYLAKHRKEKHPVNVTIFLYCGDCGCLFR